MTLPSHLKRIKIADNLFKRGDVYYYRKGDFEERLGEFKSDEKAIEARDMYALLRSRLGAESFEYRVKHLWSDYLEERRAQMNPMPGRRPLSERSFYEIESIWRKHLAKFFANRKLADIDDPLWNEYCRKAKVADLTNHRKVLKTFLKWCKINGKMRVLPEMEIPAVIRRKRKLVPLEHVRLMLQHSEGALRLFVAQYVFMGVRRGEQMLGRWEFINFQENWIMIPDENTRTRKGRAIPINSIVKRLLLEHLAAQQAKGILSPWVFPRRGQPDKPMTKDGLNKAWQTMIRHAELTDCGYEPHDLRATYEHHASKSTAHTDTQREKMAGASMDVQKRVYLHGYVADDLRGLEEVVRIDGIEKIIELKIESTGKTRERLVSGSEVSE